MNLMRAIKRWLCGCSPRTERKAENVPPDVRVASHALNNAASILQGSVVRLRKEADVLTDLTNKMRGMRDG